MRFRGCLRGRGAQCRLAVVCYYQLSSWLAFWLLPTRALRRSKMFICRSGTQSWAEGALLPGVLAHMKLGWRFCHAGVRNLQIPPDGRWGKGEGVALEVTQPVGGRTPYACRQTWIGVPTPVRGVRPVVRAQRWRGVRATVSTPVDRPMRVARRHDHCQGKDLMYLRNFIPSRGRCSMLCSQVVIRSHLLRPACLSKALRP
jgi:hypothetical protein